MLVQDFMTRDVLTVTPTTSLQQCLDFFRKHRLRRAPVVQGERMVGFISERRLLAVTPGTVAQISTDAGQVSLDMPVEQVMAKDVRVVRATDHLEVAADVMYRHRIGGLPVVDGSNRLVGILTESDLFRALWGILHQEDGTRVLIEEDPEHPGLNDVVKLADQHGCTVLSLVRYMVRSGRAASAVLRVKGGAPDAFLEALWSTGLKVVEVQRPDTGGETPASPGRRAGARPR